MHTHQTDPIPVFPTEGATVPGTRTPMAIELLEATSKARIKHHSPLPDDVVKEIAVDMITDFLDSYRTLGEAVSWVRRERKPAFVHAKVIRPYSHSLSDDERLYKTPEERKAEAQRDPLTKMRAFLLAEKIANLRIFAYD